MKYLGLKTAREQGFTMVELLVGTAIISVMVAIAIPNMGPTIDRYRLKDATRDLVSFMQEVKMAALAQNTDQIIMFDESGTPGFYYWDSDGDGNSAGEQIINFSNYGSGIDYGSGSTSTNWTPVTIATSDLATFTGELLTFSKRGLGTSGIVYLQNKNADICFAVTVLMTGSIKVREWNGTVWNE